MRIAITGGNGFIGKNVCNELLKLGYYVNLVQRSVSSVSIPESNLVRIFKINNIGSYTEWFDSINDVECIIHCAGQNNLKFKKNKLSIYREVNVNGTINLLYEAVKRGVKRFIYLSTIKVNGEETKNQKSKKTPKKSD